MNDVDTGELLRRVRELEEENARLRASVFEPSSKVVVAPEPVQPLFDQAAARLREHFARVDIDPSRAMIGISDERYVLVRASALSIDFLDTLVQLYADRGEEQALTISRGFLFDIAHTIGRNDARTMSEKLGARDPVEKLAAGPVHFAFTGWSLVDIKPESNPVPDESFCLVYDHPYSFEAASFLRAGRKSEGPVCIMNAGYSSGWCGYSFGLELTALEITCRARGDDACAFVMAPPHRIHERAREHFDVDLEALGKKGFDVPSYFERKRAEEELRESLRRLREAQDELVRKERLASVGLLVSGVAHEVNTPLGVAVTAMGVVDDEIAALGKRFDENKLTRADLRQFFERARQAAGMVRTNLDRAAQQIQNFRRVSIDQVTQEKREIDLGEYVQQTLDSLRPVVKKGALHVSLERRGDLRGSTYPGAIAQIVTNFVTNSGLHGRGSEATASEGELAVRISVERKAPSLAVLRYEDDGAGMSEEVRARAFQPFFTTARGGGGTGLGLHIVHSLVVDVLRGKIRLESAPGKGVRFEVEIPLG